MSEEDFNNLKKLVEENNKMLHSIQRRAHLSIIFSGLKILIFFGIFLGSYYYAQPYINQIIDAYTQVTSLTKGISEQKTKTENILKGFKDIMPR